MSRPPKPIDPRGPRFNQAVVASLLLVAFLVDWPPMVPAMGVVLLAGAALGPRYGPFLVIYAKLIKPRLGPPSEVEDPRPPRFAATVGAVVLAASTVAFATGYAGLAWALALVVAVLAGLAATTGICVGCEIYVLAARARGASVPRPAAPR